jgi:hypothetical protein
MALLYQDYTVEGVDVDLISSYDGDSYADVLILLSMADPAVHVTPKTIPRAF